MARSVNRSYTMPRIVLILILMSLTGCASVRIPDYIKADHPYVRKISGDYDSIITSTKNVLYREGWLVIREANPSDYERRDGEDQSKDVLLFTEPKRYSKVAYSTYTHLNVFVHANADGAEVDIRYEAVTPGPIRQADLRNDRLANRILDKIEQNVESK